MAIDLMTMPLSRYWAGAFVTPAMKDCWSNGLKHSIVTHGQPLKECPPGVAFGGLEAEKKCREILPAISKSVGQLATSLGFETWDEASEVEPRFHRVDPSSLEALQAEIATAIDREPTFLQRLLRRPGRASHFVHATIFLPVGLPSFVSTEDALVDSLQEARSELASVPGTAKSAAARVTWQAAIADALLLKLPLIVDM